MALPIPPRGFVFPYVGCGDSTTIVVDAATVVQIDLNHLVKAGCAEDPCVAVIDELVSILPKRGHRPYLAVFILTHPDLDHVRGFARLLKEVDIGEIWHTPRIFRQYENQENLCDDAKAFRKECDRRRKAMIERGGDAGDGHRLRVVGYEEEEFQEERYKDFPTSFRASAGDRVQIGPYMEVFVHSPFKDEHGGPRNDSSLAVHVTLFSGDFCQALCGLFLGDRTAPRIRRIIEKTTEMGRHERLRWHVLLAPHHCSKHAVYECVDGEEHLCGDIVGAFSASRLSPSHVVASCSSVDGDGNSLFNDDPGSNPPHRKARIAYSAMLDSPGDFLCTHEQPSLSAPQPIVFAVDNSGVRRVIGGGSGGDGATGGAPRVAPSAAVGIATGGSRDPSRPIRHA